MTAGAWLALAVLVPGALALAAARHESRGMERLALALGTGVCFWPLALLWSTAAGVAWSSGGLRLVLFAGLGLWLVQSLQAARRRRGSAWRGSAWPGVEAWALTAVLAAAGAARFAQAQSLVVPAWVDGLHHTVVTQLIVEAGRLPSSLHPYVAVDRFYYHYGFHTLAAVVAMTARMPAAAAVLVVGQALSAATVLTVWVLARRALHSPAAAVVAAAVPATLYSFPAYYVSWSRYSQLAGLVALPVAWMLTAEASRRGASWRLPGLAALAAGGLALVHYRVAVFYGLGVLLWVLWRLASERRDRAPAAAALLGRLSLVAAGGAALALPWLAGTLGGGARAMAAASPGWLRGPPGVDEVPGWLFSARNNAFWIGLAVRGLLLGLVRRVALAGGVAAFLTLAALLVRPDWLGLPHSWVLPPFSLAISLYLPVALGVGLLADAGLALLGPVVGPARGRRGACAVAVALAVAGMVASRDILNPATVLVQPADVAAATWVERNTAPDARFLVSTAHWHLGTHRGLDGGYWLPLLARRQASVPPALYPYGDPEVVRRIDRLSALAASGDALSDAELMDLMRQLDATHVYVGPAAVGAAGKLSAERLRRVAGLVEVYARDGAHVFALTQRDGAAPDAGGGVPGGRP